MIEAYPYLANGEDMGLTPFTPVFSEEIGQHAQILLAGVILTPGRREGQEGRRCSALRTMGLDREKRFYSATTE